MGVRDNEGEVTPAMEVVFENSNNWWFLETKSVPDSGECLEYYQRKEDERRLAKDGRYLTYLEFLNQYSKNVAQKDVLGFIREWERAKTFPGLRALKDPQELAYCLREDSLNPFGDHCESCSCGGEL